MEKPKIFVRRVMFDMAWMALISGVIGWIVVDLLFGIAVSLGCIWAAANFLLLGWWIGLVVTPEKGSQRFIFLVACAKLPASYLLLWWLFQVTYFEASGLAIGICLLPAVLLARGLVSIKDEGKNSTNLEEGR